jgi:hypothetical protein
MAFQATENNGNQVSFKCCCSLIAIVFTIIWFLGSAGYLDGQSGGPPTGEYNMATSFNDAGSIDGITRGICDGNYKYSVSSSGILQYAKFYLALFLNVIFSDLITIQLLTTQIYLAQISLIRWRTASPSNFSLSPPKAVSTSLSSERQMEPISADPPALVH